MPLQQIPSTYESILGLIWEVAGQTKVQSTGTGWRGLTSISGHLWTFANFPELHGLT